MLLHRTGFFLTKPLSMNFHASYAVRILAAVGSRAAKRRPEQTAASFPSLTVGMTADMSRWCFTDRTAPCLRLAVTGTDAGIPNTIVITNGIFQSLHHLVHVIHCLLHLLLESAQQSTVRLLHILFCSETDGMGQSIGRLMHGGISLGSSWLDCNHSWNVLLLHAVDDLGFFEKIMSRGSVKKNEFVASLFSWPLRAKQVTVVAVIF